MRRNPVPPVLLRLDFQAAPAASAVNPATETLETSACTAVRFREVIDYALTQLSGPSGKASQKDLADQLQLAPTMVTRYLTQRAAFDGLRATTVERLASVCGLETGAIYTWVRDGRAAAMAYQQRFSAKPVAFSPLELAEQLVTLLQEQQGLPAAAEARVLAPDHEGLLQALESARAVAPALFDRLVALTKAAQTLERVRAAEDLDQQDWFKLQQLLDEQPQVLQQRYGFAAVAQTVARTAQPCA